MEGQISKVRVPGLGKICFRVKFSNKFCSIFRPFLYSLPNPGYIRGQFTFVEGCLPLGGGLEI